MRAERLGVGAGAAGGATGNRIGDETEKRVSADLRRCAVAPLLAAQCRLAFAKGGSSRLGEDSVLGDCSIDCISTCTCWCSTQLVRQHLHLRSARTAGGDQILSPIAS
eukprot:SAG11_NODE_6274_length_1345_cov_10.872392_2_plen_108_part_00